MDLSQLDQRLQELPGQKVCFFEAGKACRKSYPELGRDIQELAESLRSRGLKPGTRVGLLAENSYHWVATELALLHLGCLSVCFPPEEFAAVAVEDLARDYALHLLLVSSQQQDRRNCQAEWIAALDRPGFVAGIRLREPVRTETNREIFDIDPDVLTIVFSSGTSGKLKQLKISKAGTEALIESFGRWYRFRPDDAILAFLPLSVYQQRWMVYTAIRYGFDLQIADTGLFLFKALKEFRPTILGAPPAFYETLENRFRTLPPRRQLALKGAGRLAALAPLKSWRDRLARKVFAPFYAALGGRIRLMLIGAAPTRQSTWDFFRLMRMPLYEGYGLTETGYISINLPGRHRVGSVGRPLIEGSVLLADDGEIIFECPRPLSRGYLFCDPEEERRTFLSPQRIATGDVGRLDEDGFLYLTGRKKEIIVTQAGVKVHPETLELEIERCPDVSRAVVFGRDRLPGLAALVSLRPPGRDEASRRVTSYVDRLNQKLPASVRIQRVVCTGTPLTLDNGMLNRNLKIDRRAVYETFRQRLEAGPGGVEKQGK